VRTIGFSRAAQEQTAYLPEPARGAVESYCRGVNFYLSASADELPLEFRLLGYTPGPWQPQDTLVVMKYLEYLESESWKLDDLRQRVLTRAGERVFNRLFSDEWPLQPAARAPADRQTQRPAISAVPGAPLPPRLAAALAQLGSVPFSTSGSSC